ncbi:hypothetical protein QZH41_012285 [Actinostola sp. cb2023]|nr:hypothetical protein QZH41_012285 [Actinostola sp. cb2023]
MADCVDGEIPPVEAKLFHSLPHVNFNFDNISTTFKPTDKDYQQNLLLYSSVPALFGGFWFIIFAVYFLVYCCSWCCKRCKKQITRRKNRTKCAACLALCIWFCALICCGSIIAGFVFNDGIENGVLDVTSAMQNVSNNFDNIHSQVASIQNNILDIKENIGQMMKLPDIPFPVKEYLQEIKLSVLEIIEALNGVKKMKSPDIVGYIKTGEYYRWWTTLGVLGLGIITCLFAVYSSIRRSRCGFFLALLLGCFVFLLDWVIIGSHLGASIGMSDLCVDPRKTVTFYLRTSSFVTKDIVNYYLDCKPGSVHPYEKYVDSSLDLILTADDFLQKLKGQSWLPQQDIYKLTSDLHDTESSLNAIRKSLKCATVKQEYQKAHCAVCFPVMGGLSWLLLVSLVFVVFMAIMLLLITPMCERIHRKKRSNSFVNTMLNGAESTETQYHSVSSEESMPLLPSCAPPPYEATARTVDFQFHSCQEDRIRASSMEPVYQPDEHSSCSSHQEDRYATNNPQNNMAPPPLRGEVVPIQRKVTIAF